MKVNSTDLLKALAVACRVVPNKPIMPLQEYITISASDTHGSIRAFSDTLQISVKMECSSDDDFTVTIHNTAFVAYIQKLPQNTDITLTKDDNLIIVKWEKGKSSFPICEEDIPAFNNNGTDILKMSLNNLKTGVAQLRSFCATDELRPSMCCLCIDPDNTREDGIKMVAFNKFGGAVVADNAKISNPRRVLIHPSAFAVITNIAAEDGAETSIMASDNNVFICTERVLLQIRAVDQQYPPYERVIPIDFSRHLSIEKTGLLSAIRRCTACSSEKNILKMTLGGMNVVSAQDLQNAVSAEEIIDATQYDGESLEIGLNAGHVVNAMQIFSDAVVKFSFMDATRPMIMTSDTDPVKVVLTPMQL